MTRPGRVLAIAFALIAAGIVACMLLQPRHNDGLTHIFMLNIGQGDSFLIEAADGKKVLIDGGRDTTVLSELAKILPPGDTVIDVMIATHPDADHIGGLQYVLQRYHVELFLTSQTLTDTKTFTALYQELAKEHTPSYYARHGMVLTLDTHPVTIFTILFPDRPTVHWQTNQASVVGRLLAGDRSALFTGDSTIPVEHFLIQTEPAALHSDILKVGHHGSKYSSSAEYLKTVSPTLGLISAGVGNRYGHPSVDAVQRLKDAGIPWISTQQKGTVELTTDGISPWKWRSL